MNFYITGIESFNHIWYIGSNYAMEDIWSCCTFRRRFIWNV